MSAGLRESIAGFVAAASLEHLVEAKEGEEFAALSWAGLQRGNKAPHLSKVHRGGFVVVRVDEPTGAGHPSGSRHVLLLEERLALLLEERLARVHRLLEVEVGDATIWVAAVVSLDFVGTDPRSGCTIWQRPDAAAVYIPLSQIHRSTHCVHLCGDGCASGLNEGEDAVGLIGEHQIGHNALYLLNEHFLR